MDLFMGGYLGKLHRAKLVYTAHFHDEARVYLTDLGKKMLADNQHLLEEPT